ncbi:MAG: hypothetical protein AAF533_11700 [Acidobacteriota bacterium]
MTVSEKKRSGSDPESVLTHLNRCLDDAAGETLASSREALRAEGLDPAVVEADGLALIERQLGQQRLAEARGALDRLRGWIQRAADDTRDGIQQVREELLAYVAGEMPVAALYRGLESIEPEDQESLLADIRLLELWNDRDDATPGD